MKRLTVFLLVLVACLPSCDDIFEKDLSGLTVGVVAPGEGVELIQGRVVFAWHEVSGAQFYRLRVVSPSFAEAGRVLVDTLMCSDSLRGRFNYGVTLLPGNYQWSLLASNFSSQGTELVRTLSVVSGEVPETDLSQSAVEVITPQQGSRPTAGKITFSWKEVTGATGYNLRVVSPAIDNVLRVVADTVVYPDPLHGNPVCRLDIAAGQYQWGVRARNTRSQSAEAVQSFQVVPDIRDRDISGAGVTIVAPGAGAELTEGEVLFCWEPLDGAADYRLRVASPSFGNINRILVDTLIAAGTSSGSVTCKRALPAGDYQWSVLPRNPSYQGQETVRSLKILPHQTPKAEDISLFSVADATPGNGTALTEGEISFGWSGMYGATGYRLRIVSPSFAVATQVITDTVIHSAGQYAGLIYKRGLKAGDYQWSIRAFNADYQSQETVRSLKITPKQGADRDITDRTVDIVAPAAGITIMEGEVTFCWNALDGAVDYQLRVVSPSFSQAATVLADKIITAQQDGSLNFKVTLPAGDYQWSIRARNPSYKSRETIYSLKVLPAP